MRIELYSVPDLRRDSDESKLGCKASLEVGVFDDGGMANIIEEPDIDDFVHGKKTSFMLITPGINEIIRAFFHLKEAGKYAEADELDTRLCKMASEYDSLLHLSQRKNKLTVQEAISELDETIPDEFI